MVLPIIPGVCSGFDGESFDELCAYSTEADAIAAIASRVIDCEIFRYSDPDSDNLVGAGIADGILTASASGSTNSSTIYLGLVVAGPCDFTLSISGSGSSGLPPPDENLWNIGAGVRLYNADESYDESRNLVISGSSAGNPEDSILGVLSGCYVVSILLGTASFFTGSGNIMFTMSANSDVRISPIIARYQKPDMSYDEIACE